MLPRNTWPHGQASFLTWTWLPQLGHARNKGILIQIPWTFNSSGSEGNSNNSSHRKQAKTKPRGCRKCKITCKGAQRERRPAALLLFLTLWLLHHSNMAVYRSPWLTICSRTLDLNEAFIAKSAQFKHFSVCLEAYLCPNSRVLAAR